MHIFSAPRYWSSSHWDKFIGLACYDEELEWAALCAAHPFWTLSVCVGGGAVLAYAA